MVSVQLNQDTMERIKKLKLHPREPHDETINRLIYEHDEVIKETINKEAIKEVIKEVK